MKRTMLFFSCKIAVLCTALSSNAQFSLSIGINVSTAPPPLPVYSQPPCPVDGYLWSPGYWAWDDDDGYYWVPGVWIMPPQPNYLWTPGYWGYTGGYYGWHSGYWGPHVGFYGGVNYGYGYGGSGFYGGRWEGGHYRYNTAVVQVNNTVVHNTYIDKTVINNTTINNTTVNNRVSYNGGAGTNAKPTAGEQQAMHETHVRPTSDQVTHNQAAAKDRNQFAVVNKGRPQTAAMDKPGGGRFDTQGKNAPAPVARPAGKLSTAGANANSNIPGKPANPNNNRPNDKQHKDANVNNNQPANGNNPSQQRDNGRNNPKPNDDNDRKAPAPKTIPAPNTNKQQHMSPVPHPQVRQANPQNQVHPQTQPVHPLPQHPNPVPRNNPNHNDHPQGEHHK